MKKFTMILLAGCAFVLSYRFQTIAVADAKIPLRKLAGTYALTVQGSYFLCREKLPPHAPVACDSEGAIGVPITALAVGGSTLDAEGNACVTWTETDADTPVTVSPPTVYVVHQTTTTTSYDPTTGTGDGTFTNYFGGTCHGATFDNTGATVVSSGTYHFTVSNHGKRIDNMVTALTNPAGAIGGFSISATDLRE